MLKTAVMIMATSYVAWYIERFEHEAVYPFDKSYTTPAEAGAPGLDEDVLVTEDGEQLIVWRAAARDGFPTVLYFPGNAGGLKERAERFGHLIDQGFGLAALAYRGSSGSSGQPEEEVLVRDALALALGETGPLVIYGESLGAAVAVRIAAVGIGERLVLEAPFTSIPDLLLAQYPTETLGHLITQRWESLAAVPEVTQPLLVIHGERDRLVPIHMGERMLAAAGSAEKQLIRVAEAGHSGLWTMGVRAALFGFLGR